MKKFLFVSFTSEQAYTGGLQCSKRNYKSICNLLGEDCVIKYTITPYKEKHSFKTKFKRFKDIFKGYMGGLDDDKVLEVIQLIQTNNISDVFLDSSLLGKLAKIIRLRFPTICIYTFFHNVEYDFVRDYVKFNVDYLRFYWLILAKINEKFAVENSSKIISLNSRDANSIKKYYGRNPDIQIPITLEDKVEREHKLIPSNNKKALFVGSYFYGNVHGLKWFCSEVLPHTSIELTIVGAGMDFIKNDLTNTANIEIYSNVPDLNPFFDDADFVVLPILSGSGMKVKTAESLMNGKFIIGTDEAFRGYDITEKVGVICNSAQEFIVAINNLNLSYKFNNQSRNLYLEKYSFESSLKDFKTIFEL